MPVRYEDKTIKTEQKEQPEDTKKVVGWTNEITREFQTQAVPFALMAPLKGICLGFRFGTC